MCAHSETRIIATRVAAPGVIRRRHECLQCQRRHNTIELHETVVRAFGAKQIYARAKFNLDAIHKRSATNVRRTEIEQLLRAGWKSTAIAHHVGVTEARVRQIRKELV